jgi:hypothetical protein
MKLDGKFYGEIRKAKDDSLVGEDEYVVFLAKDDAFAQVLPIYRLACLGLGCDAAQLASLDRMIARVNEWREWHPDRCKKPDANGEKLLA